MYLQFEIKLCLKEYEKENVMITQEESSCIINGAKYIMAYSSNNKKCKLNNLKWVEALLMRSNNILYFECSMYVNTSFEIFICMIFNFTFREQKFHVHLNECFNLLISKIQFFILSANRHNRWRSNNHLYKFYKIYYKNTCSKAL